MRFFKYWNRFVTLGGILIALIVCSIGILVLSQISNSAGLSTNEPQMTIIPASTYTVTPDEPDTGELSPTKTSEPGNGLQIGVYVQITGTNGSGLRIRSNPGLNTDVNFLGMDNEMFVVKDGPIEADDYAWWFIESPYDSNRSGWSASDFLSIIEQ